MQNPSLVSPHRRRPHGRWTTRLILTAALLTTYHVGAPLSVQGAVPTNLFFSEYIEGSSNNKALEILNGTGGTVNLATQGYNVQIFFNGASTAGLTINLTGTVNYNAEFKSPNQVNTLSAANAFRSADHDPLIVDLNLNAPVVNAGGPYSVSAGGTVVLNGLGDCPGELCDQLCSYVVFGTGTRLMRSYSLRRARCVSHKSTSC